MNQDGVEVAGWLEDWRADMLGGGETRKAAKTSRRLSRTGTESSQNHCASCRSSPPVPSLICRTRSRRLAGHASFVEKAPVAVHGRALLLRDLGDYIFNCVLLDCSSRCMSAIAWTPPPNLKSDTHAQINEVQVLSEHRNETNGLTAMVQ